MKLFHSFHNTRSKRYVTYYVVILIIVSLSVAATPPINSGELKMKLRIDDSGITSGLGNSFIQIPLPDEAFPGYCVSDNNNFPLVTVINKS